MTIGSTTAVTRPGTYTVCMEVQGFQTLNRENVAPEVGKEVRVDLTPAPGQQTQSVTINEAIPLVDTASATLGGTLANQEINDLPLNGRNYQGLLSLRPGVLVQKGGSPWTQLHCQRVAESVGVPALHTGDNSATGAKSTWQVLRIGQILATDAI